MFALNCVEVAPARAPDVHNRRLAGAERVAVGMGADVAVAQVRVGGGADEHVRVQVDQAGDDVEARDVGDALGLRRLDGRGDGRDLAVGDGHVHHGVDAVLRIDDVPALEQQAVAAASARRPRRRPAARRARRGPRVSSALVLGPQRPRPPVQVPHDLAGLHRQLALELLRAGHLRSRRCPRTRNRPCAGRTPRRPPRRRRRGGRVRCA